MTEQNLHLEGLPPPGRPSAGMLVFLQTYLASMVPLAFATWGFAKLVEVVDHYEGVVPSADIEVAGQVAIVVAAVA